MGKMDACMTCFWVMMIIFFFTPQGNTLEDNYTYLGGLLTGLAMGGYFFADRALELELTLPHVRCDLGPDYPGWFRKSAGKICIVLYAVSMIAMIVVLFTVITI